MNNNSAWQERYGPWAIVTGASDGIGQEFARQLAAAGLNLVLIARRRHLMEALADELHTRHGIETRIIATDLARPDGVTAVLDATQTLDIGLLIAAAGFGTTGAFIDLPLTRELDMLDVNCRAVTALSHHYARRFVERRRGGIVLISSIVAFQGVPLSAQYAATKAYIQSLAEGLRAELRPLGVDVIAATPGPVSSGFAAQADMVMGAALQPRVVAEETLRALGRRTSVRPGLLSKLLIGSLGLLPRDWRVRAMGQIMRGMTRHQSPAPAVSPSALP